jgi:hypothetical protein
MSRLLPLALMIAMPTVALAEVRPIGQLTGSDGTVIEGKVTHVFGNKFVLADETGSVLVDTGPRWFKQRAFKVGEVLKVRGEVDEQEFEARTVSRASGEVDTIRADRGPPPWSGKARKAESRDRD